MTPQHTRKYVASGCSSRSGSTYTSGQVMRRPGKAGCTGRLFMFMAERAGLPVAAKLARNRIDLGKGARSIVPKGASVAKHEIVVPRFLVRE